LKFIGCLPRGQEPGVGVEPPYEHIGVEHAAQSHIDGGEEGRQGLAHDDLLEWLATAQ
jgi:hypothetical protein